MTRRVLAMVCHFPPPVHGAALISERVRSWFVRQGRSVVPIDTAPHSLKRGVRYYLTRLTRLSELWRLLRLGNGDVIYCSVNSNWGVLIDLGVAILARALGLQLWMHHHSFFYLNEISLLHLATFSIGSGRVHHIVLSRVMKDKLVGLYGIGSDQVHLLSNINFVPPADTDVPCSTQRRITLGFLSNITEEKGIADFVKLSDRLRNLPLDFQVAGPIVDRSYSWLQNPEANSIHWVGVLGEKEKQQFLAQIDILVFPTRYRNEAEPLVIYEAMAAGIVVVAYERGCIREMLHAPHMAVTEFDELERSVRGLIRLLPSRSEVRERYRMQRTACQEQISVLSLL